MFCPVCGAEYQPGFGTCAACGVDLAEELPLSPTEQAMDSVVVFSDGRPEIVAIAKSILMSTDIEFAVCGEGIQDMFGWGRFPAGTNVFIGPVEIRVLESDAADALSLLDGIGSTGQALDSADLGENDTDSQELGCFRRHARTLLKIFVGVVLTYFVAELLYAIVSALLSLWN